MSESTHTPLLILGAGPAGLAAALYAARADLQPIVLTGPELGGQVSITYIVENYPGFPEGVEGPDLVTRFKEQAEKFGARLVLDTATAVDFRQRPFRIRTTKTEYTADTVIIATGATAKQLEIPGEDDLIGMGVSYCATCDGHFFKGMDIMVVGGGDSALEEALFLTRYANSVTIVHRRDALRAGPLLQKRARNHPKIRFLMETIVTEILGDEMVEGVRLQHLPSGEEREHPIAGVFIFIGYHPNTDLFEGQITLDERGYIAVDKHMHTNIPGVFAAGEVADSRYRQVITSAGMGAAAAMEAIHFLENQGLP